MARDRKSLDQTLRVFTNNVYYQPPATVKMSFPAIRYRRVGIDIRHADDDSYNQTRSYEIIVIDRDPDSELVTKVSQLPGIRHGRSYQADGLNHDLFTINW